MRIKLKPTCIAILLSCGVAVSAHADLTVKQNTNGQGLGISKNAVATTCIKGNKMRSDVVMGDKTQTTIFDIDAQKMFIFDSKKKEVDVWDMAAFAQEISKNIDASSIKASLKPNGQTKEIDGHTAAGYDMDISLRSAMNGNKSMMMEVTLQGPLWIVKDSPGAADYNRFYKAAADKGWIFTDPRVAKGQSGQAKAIAEMYKQISDIGGVPYETDVQVKIGGDGPMGAVLAKMGNMTFSTVLVTVDTGSLSDDLFAPPADYKLNPRK